MKSKKSIIALGILVVISLGFQLHGPISKAFADAGTRYHFVICKDTIGDYEVVYYHLTYVGGSIGQILKWDDSSGEMNSTVSWSNASKDMTVDSAFLCAAGSLDRALPAGKWICRAYGSTDAIKNSDDVYLGGKEFIVGGKDKKNDDNRILLETNDI